MKKILCAVGVATIVSAKVYQFAAFKPETSLLIGHRTRFHRGPRRCTRRRRFSVPEYVALIFHSFFSL